MTRQFVLHDGKKGSALAVRVTPRADRNQIAGLLPDGTIKIQLASTAEDESSNKVLLSYLAEVLGVPQARMEIVAGESGRDKLVSILDMDSETAHQRVLAHVE